MESDGYSNFPNWKVKGFAMEESEVLSALAAKKQAEAQMAKAAHCPLWRHAVFGLLMGGLVASPAFPLAIRTLLLVLILASIPIIINSDRKRMGMFISGYRRGKTRVVVVGILIVELALYGLSVYYGLALNDHRTPLLLGFAGFLIGTVGSVIWQHIFVREMRA
jgi:hypothetical protein